MQLLLDYAPLLLSGAMLSLALALCSVALAIVLGTLGAAAKLGHITLLRHIAQAYTTCARGVPDLVLMLLFYFGGERFINSIRALMGFERINVSAFTIGVLTIGFIYGAYLTETFRGAYMSIPRGQIEAAKAYGLRRNTILFRIIFPQLVCHALPGFTNTWLVLVKSIAIVSIVGLDDLVGLAFMAGRAKGEPFLFITVIMAFFLLLTSLSSYGLNKLEQRYPARG